MLQHHADQLRPEHGHRFKHGRSWSVIRQFVVRLPELEQELDLSSSAIQHHDFFPGQQLAGSVGHEQRPSQQLGVLRGQFAPAFASFIASLLTTSMGHFFRDTHGDQTALEAFVLSPFRATAAEELDPHFVGETNAGTVSNEEPP